MSEPTDLKGILAENVARTRRREIIFPTIGITVLFVIFLAVVIWAGFAYDEAMTRLSDSLVAFLFLVWTLVCLALILINTMLIALLMELRKNLPEKLDTANEKVHAAEPVILDALNRFSEPVINLIAKFNALFHVIKRT